jgi:hypothetical protein
MKSNCWNGNTTCQRTCSGCCSSESRGAASVYAADAPVANCAHALLVDSTIGNGKITSIDSAAALKKCWG